MIRLAIPSIEKKEIKSVLKVLKSGYLVQGKKVDKFERVVADYVNVKYGIAVSSGTAALHLALLVLDIGSGDEVIVPDFTYPATANVIELAGARPVFIDIDKDTFNIDASKIEEKINKKTKAIIPVHLFGQAADMDKIAAIAKKYNLFVIEDAACALGAEHNGHRCAGLGDIGCVSFHPRKTVTTGEGGMILTRDINIARKARALRNHGINIKRNKIDFMLAGFNYRMTEIAAAIGIEQMKKINSIISKKQRLAAMYGKLFENIEWLKTPYTAKGNNHTFQSYVLKITQPNKDRDSLIGYLRNRGVEVTIGTYALHEVKFYKKKYLFRKEDFAYSSHAYHKCLAIPMHHALTEKQIKFIVTAINNFHA